jgi:hypothetical protein
VVGHRVDSGGDARDEGDATFSESVTSSVGALDATTSDRRRLPTARVEGMVESAVPVENSVMSSRRTSLPAALFALLFVSCGNDGSLDDGEAFTISGQLRSDFGCYQLRDGKNYELYGWRDEIPPLGSEVSLRVIDSQYDVSACMSGTMVDVLEILSVRSDFRTTAVTEDETWGPDDEIILGQVEVKPGVTLTVLPGTLIQIIPQGEFRVRGRILMEGTPEDSIRIDGILLPDGGRQWPGKIILDSVSTDSRVRFLSTRQIQIYGDAPVLEDLGCGVFVQNGTATIRNSRPSGVGGQTSQIIVEDCDIETGVWGTWVSFVVKRSTLTGITLSYSRATATENVFRGALSTIIFHGPSGGTFERNTFEADSTHIEVRHDSDPMFQQNNFVGRALTIECNTYSGPCVDFRNNWWGTTDEGVIASRFIGPCDFCYRPWLTEPVVW